MLATWGTSTGFNPASLFAGGVQGAWYDPSDFPPNWRVNLLTYTEQFDNAAWVKLNTTVGADAVTAPDGTLTADRAINNTTSGRHTLTNTATGAALGITYTASVYVKKETQRYIVFGDAGDSVWRLITFDFDTATITGQTNVTSSSVTSVGDGWFRLVFTATRTAAAGNYDIFVGFTSTSTNSSPPTYVGSTDDKFYVWGAQLQLGSTATAYQQIVTPEISFLQYNPQPVMFQDAAGTTPVTAVEQAVGLICDKRNGTNFSVRYNLFSFSEQLNNSWTAGSNVTVTANSAVAPNGTTTADTVAATATSGSGFVAQTISHAVTTYTISAYVKANTGSVIWLYVRNTSVNGLVYFDLNDLSTQIVAGSSFTPTNVTITSVGSGWYRVAATIQNGTVQSTGSGFGVCDAKGSLAVTAGRSVLFWGAQLEVGSSATTYQPTETYPTSWPSGNHAFQSSLASRPTLRARYNLLTYSEELNDASWVKSNSSITQDSTTAPNGTLTADTLVENTATNIHAVTSISVTFAASSQHRLSVYAKPSGRNWILIQFPTVPFGATTRAWFDVSTGTVGTRENCTGSISNEGNGWFRCTITATTTVGGAGTSAFYTSTGDGLSSYTGDGTSGLFLWGAQIVPTAVFPSNVYQRIAAATDYATGAAFPQYLSFDGTDDSLLTANVDFATVTSDGQARRNLLLNPTQFDAAAWTRTNTTVTANATTAPDNTSTADEIVNTTAAPTVFQNAGTLGTGVYTASCYLKKSTARYGYIILVIGSSRYSVLIDLDNGQFVNDYNTTTPLTSKGYQIQSVGDGWYRLSVTGANTSGGTGFAVVEDSDTAIISVNANLDITNATIGSKIFAWGAQLETGSTATAFQNIGTDKMTVFSGLSKLSDAAAGIVAELSVTIGSNNGSFVVVAPTGAAGNNYQYAARGTVTSSATSAATFASPITNVVTGQSDIGVPTISIRVNTVATTSALTQGTGNYGNYPLYIGRRGGTSQPFNGRIYSLIVRGAASNTTQVAQTERYVASKTPLGTV